MNINKIIFRYLLVIFVLFSTCKLFSQNTSDDGNLYELVEQKYGLDQILLNGRYFENVYINDLGHPYFAEDAYKNGYLVIQNKKYDNIQLKYNIFDQTLVVLHTDKSNAKRAFMPPMVFVSEFSIDNHRFKKYSFKPKGKEIYEEIYLGQISCLCFWEKDRSQSEHKQSFMAHKFSEPEKDYVLVMDNKPYSIKNKNALLKLFPNHKKDIGEYLKQHKIRLYKSSDEQIAKLFGYCEKLYTNHTKTK